MKTIIALFKEILLSIRHIANLRVAMGLMLMGSLNACASLDVNTMYKAPAQSPIPSSATVKKPFEKAWADFVRNLSQSFFVVNNISKDSRLINISVNQSQAGKFIDCGTVSYTINDKPWSFNPARNANFSDGGFRTETNMLHRVQGSGGRMNVFVAPDGDKTTFEVNTSYTMEMRQTGESTVRNLVGRVVDRVHLPEQTAVFQFTTKQPDQQLLGSAQITCQATGVWEQLVLDLAR